MMIEQTETLPDDAERLAALNDLHLLDTAPEDRFDDIVELASMICDAPIALVSLVDGDRQWFKARRGLDLAETPIEQLVRALATQQQEVFVIEDLATDPRTAGNPLVTAPGGIRFYAGAPLVTAERYVIGSLCVTDRAPRPGGLTTRQAASLATLGRHVVQAIEARQIVGEQSSLLRRARRGEIVALGRLQQSHARGDALERSDARSRSAQEAGRVGTFDLDIATDVADVSAEFCRLFGLPQAAQYSFEDLERHMIRDEAIVHSTRSSRDDGTAVLDVEYRIRRPDDGKVRWIARRAAFELDAQGEPARLRGTIQDVTERRLAGERIEALLALGDTLRDMDDVPAIAAAAARALCNTLHASRCGYASIDLQQATLTIEEDLATGDRGTIKGVYPLDKFGATIERLRGGQTSAHADVESSQVLAGDLPGYRAFGARAQVTVPMVDRNELKGALFVHEALPRVWDPLEIEFVQSVADRTYAAIAKARAEQQRQLLNNELSHRLKNTLAIIQAIATQTLRKVTERDAVKAFGDRLMALSGAHEVLLQRSWTAARIDEVVAGVCGKLGIGDRVHRSGPGLVIGAQAALGLSLLIHELATNAVKYGALSVPDGQVHLHWAVDGVGDEAQFTLGWRERGGPPAEEPERKGFGSRLVSAGLVGTGGATVRFLGSGFEADFVASLARLKSD